MRRKYQKSREKLRDPQDEGKVTVLWGCGHVKS